MQVQRIAKANAALFNDVLDVRNEAAQVLLKDPESAKKAQKVLCNTGMGRL